MNKHLIGGVVIVGLVSVMAILFLNHQTAEAPAAERIGPPEQIDISTTTSDSATTSPRDTTGLPPDDTRPKPPGIFSGTLTEVNTGCFVDGECFVVVGGKHATIMIGRKQEVVGSIVGAPSISDLNAYIGETATVYAKALPDGRYTLYGNASYYVAVTPKAVNGCVVGGCSSQLCGEAGDDLMSTCEWREEYACYQTGRCERQADGQCGWTETTELLACVARARDGASIR